MVHVKKKKASNNTILFLVLYSPTSLTPSFIPGVQQFLSTGETWHTPSPLHEMLSSSPHPHLQPMHP